MTTNPTHRLADQLWQLHSMEDRLATAFPVLAGSVMHRELRGLLSQRARQARDRRDRLARLGAPHHDLSGLGVCPAIKKILAEGNRELAVVHHPCTRDFVMLAHWIRTEQYAIVAYGVAAPVVNRIGFSQVATKINSLLSELITARHLLKSMEAEVSHLAEAHIARTGVGNSPAVMSFTR